MIKLIELAEDIQSRAKSGELNRAEALDYVAGLYPQVDRKTVEDRPSLSAGNVLVGEDVLNPAYGNDGLKAYADVAKHVKKSVGS